MTPAVSIALTKGIALPSRIGTSVSLSISIRTLSIPNPASAESACSTVLITMAPELIAVPRLVETTLVMSADNNSFRSIDTLEFYSMVFRGRKKSHSDILSGMKTNPI